jgi:hypothetical protein
MGAAATLVSRDDRRYVEITCELCEAGAVVGIEYEVAAWPGLAQVRAHGERRISYGFVNSLGARMPAVEGTLVLPEGFAIAAIDEVDPPVGDATIALPYQVAARQGRQTIALSPRALAAGEHVRVTGRIAPARSSRMVLTAAMVLAAAYLLKFRNLISS